MPISVLASVEVRAKDVLYNGWYLAMAASCENGEGRESNYMNGKEQKY
jgi:hypothetical protein